jgi:hypothetical protein
MKTLLDDLKVLRTMDENVCYLRHQVYLVRAALLWGHHSEALENVQRLEGAITQLQDAIYAYEARSKEIGGTLFAVRYLGKPLSDAIPVLRTLRDDCERREDDLWAAVAQAPKVSTIITAKAVALAGQTVDGDFDVELHG